MAEPPARSFDWRYELGEIGEGLVKVLIFLCLWYLPMLLVVNAHTRSIKFLSGARPDLDRSVCDDPTSNSARCYWIHEDWSWKLPPGSTLQTIAEPASPGAARGVAGYMSVQDGCQGATVAWEITTGDAAVASGSVEPGPPQEVVTMGRGTPPIEELRVLAHRTDTASCTAVFQWSGMQVDAALRVWPWELLPG